MDNSVQLQVLKDALDKGILTEKEYKTKVSQINNPTEPLSFQKFKKIFYLFNGVEWIKSLKELGILDVRKWIIFALIGGSIFGYGYLNGIKNKPVHFNLEGKEATIKLNNHYLHILPDGSAQVEDEKGQILKKIAVKDIPELQKALKPVGIDVRPFFTSGYGASVDGKKGAEAGVGTSLFKFYRVHLDTWLTNRGAYLGADYQITGNFSVIAGGGKGYEGDNRAYIGGAWRF